MENGLHPPIISLLNLFFRLLRHLFEAMARTAPSSSATVVEQPPPSTVHQLEVACAELKSLPETRAVYEKRGVIFFRTTIRAAAISQQKELEKAKKRTKKLES